MKVFWGTYRRACLKAAKRKEEEEKCLGQVISQASIKIHKLEPNSEKVNAMGTEAKLRNANLLPISFVPIGI